MSVKVHASRWTGRVIIQMVTEIEDFSQPHKCVVLIWAFEQQRREETKGFLDRINRMFRMLGGRFWGNGLQEHYPASGWGKIQAE
jgi:hypothetical protein